MGYDGEKMCAHTKEKPSNKSPSKSAMNEIVVYPQPHTHTHTESERDKEQNNQEQIRCKQKKERKKHERLSHPVEESKGSREEAREKKILLNKS